MQQTLVYSVLRYSPRRLSFPLQPACLLRAPEKTNHGTRVACSAGSALIASNNMDCPVRHSRDSLFPNHPICVSARFAAFTAAAYELGVRSAFLRPRIGAKRCARFGGGTLACGLGRPIRSSTSVEVMGITRLSLPKASWTYLKN